MTEVAKLKPEQVVLYPNTRGNLRWGRVLAVFIRNGKGYAAIQPQGETYTVVMESADLTVAINTLPIRWPDVNPLPSLEEDPKE